MAELSKENKLQRDAFEIYYALGEIRSLKRVAEQIHRTERTVAGWSREFSWIDRIKQREIEEAKNADKNALNTQTTDVKTKYRILVNNLMAQASKDIKEGKLKIRNMQDLERVIKLDLLLMGESTEREEHLGSTELSQADKDRLDEITRLLKGD